MMANVMRFADLITKLQEILASSNSAICGSISFWLVFCQDVCTLLQIMQGGFLFALLFPYIANLAIVCHEYSRPCGGYSLQKCDFCLFVAVFFPFIFFYVIVFFARFAMFLFLFPGGWGKAPDWRQAGSGALMLAVSFLRRGSAGLFWLLQLVHLLAFAVRRTARAEGAFLLILIIKKQFTHLSRTFFSYQVYFLLSCKGLLVLIQLYQLEINLNFFWKLLEN